ncbi:hypothetical protein K6U27_15600 [Vibrio fluvialis]|uniref:hypothetical protein n=1 Tax=Vibrio fluvialis TaxID=676 RepID=UPI001EEC36A0|nr:hypothetical protein [Vibrio fluvialis]MCG6374091.1 hypothetical protein [Vibrio fluvialis]
MNQVSLKQQLYLSLLQIDDLMAVMNVATPEYDELWQQQDTLRQQYTALVIESLQDTSQIQDAMQGLEELCDESRRVCDELNENVASLAGIARVIRSAGKVTKTLAKLVT